METTKNLCFRILNKLGVEPLNSEAFQILVSALNTILPYTKDKSLESLKSWDAPVLTNLKSLTLKELEFIESQLPNINIPIDECQVKVQKLVPQRKKFAAYYTINTGVNFMASIVYNYLKDYGKDKLVLADPFFGSGRTLTGTINRIGAEKVELVWGVEPISLSALVGYAAVLKALKGKKDIIRIIVGDAFRTFKKFELQKADVILTNPPFTRWKYLEKNYRDYLLNFIGNLGYKKYITRKEASLQMLSMFLSDYMLKKGGLLVSVLPVSTFYTIYGKGYKSFIKDNYKVLAMLESTSRSSFSEDSGFKECIFVSIKEKTEEDFLTVFTELDDKYEKIADLLMKKDKLGVDLFNIHNLPRFLDINWLSLFGKRDLRNFLVELFNQGLKKKTLECWDKSLDNTSIVRGVEMYGPEFFFVPNKHWKILDQNKNYLEIENIENKMKLSLDKRFLVKTLRKPSLYDRVIELEVESYMVSIPPKDIKDLPQDWQEYIKWGFDSATATPAIRSYGKLWYSHVYKQMVTKEPFGHIFIPNKVDVGFKKRGVFANYSQKNLAASKNFYIIKDKDERTIKLLIGWFNSTIFISSLLLLGRRISNNWTQLLKNDYLELPVINVEGLDENDVTEICESVEKILRKPLPPLWEQLNEDYRYNLDLSIAKSLKIEEPEKTVKRMYKILDDYINN